MAEADPGLEGLLQYLHQSRGFDFTGYKRPTLARRIAHRMSKADVESFADYVDYLEVHPEEFAALFDTILINVTEFFRDPPAWDYLSRVALPPLISSRQKGESIRVWSAGCASGEEAYTIAMVLAELLGHGEFLRRVKIYPTDIEEEALAKAHPGYTA